MCDEEVSRKTVEVAALGHTAGEAEKENEVAATCTAAGSYEEVVCCTVCGEEMSRKTVTVDALGHDYKGVVTDEALEALCLVPGEMTYTCTRCNDSYKEEIAPLRHSWSETKPGLAPTCTSAGYTSYETCTRCGYSNRDIIPAAGHQGGKATCQEKAVCEVCHEPYGNLGDHTPGTDYIADENGHWFACSVCGEELKGTTYAVHDYTGGVQNCKTCDVTDSQYFYFTLLDDGSSYGIGQMVTALDEPDYNNPENPYISLSTFTEKVKLPDYYKDLPITELTGMTVELTIEVPGLGSITESVPYDSFYYNTTLTSIELSNFITEIPKKAFTKCTSLESIEIPDSVTTISEYAFGDCTSLMAIKIPDSVTSIGGYAFDGCTSLMAIKIPDSVTSIGQNVFMNCTSLKSVTLPQGITTIVDSMFSGCTSLTTIENLDSVTTIGYNAFKGCTSLNEGFEIPKDVTKIGYSAFEGCTSLTSITIPEGVTTIENYVFEDCTALESVILLDGITSIGGAAFRNTGLISINLPSSLKSIDFRAFENCDKLTTITIPANVTTIGGNAFYDCDSLSTAIFEDQDSTWSIHSSSNWTGRDFTPSDTDYAGAAQVLISENEYTLDWKKQTD